MTLTATHEYDAVIIGAGPAGCAAARLLAAWGHRTLLVARPESDTRALAESIPPSAQKVLAALGMLTSFEDAGFLPWLGNTVWWGDDEPRTEAFAPGQAGYLVSRTLLDRRLRKLAAESGADVRAGVVRDVRLDPDGESAEATRAVDVEVDIDGERVTVQTRFVLDCSGRAGVIARKGPREPVPSPRTVALVGVWRASAGWPSQNDAHTLVASYSDGWAWSVPTEPGLRHFTVMVEPGRTELTGDTAEARYTSELAKVRPFAALLASATLLGRPWGADASLYRGRRYTGPGWLLAGDAASFIDPLSSFGVKKALVSGWLAAIAVHTSLTQPAMAGEALRFFDRRERSMAAGSRTQGAQFARDAAADTPHPFWLARAAASQDDLDADAEIDPAALARDPGVLAAFEDVRRRDTIRLIRDARARFETRAMVRGREIVLDEQLVAPACPDGIRYLRGIDLVRLVTLAPDFDDVGALFEALRRDQPDVTLPDFLGALSVLIHWKALLHEG
ncbi:MAG TPA: FAD-dependent monooxygenase [Vicinamibacterales bacterium]|nr:FAD-dependent monooxygenase [Vicinamibacterales bacterium]